MVAALLVTFLSRLVLVLLFFPFSAFDKAVNFKLATRQARQATASDTLARGLIVAGGVVEVVMSLGVLTGVADRFCAFVLAGYCMVTAVVWKRFWEQTDFRLRGPSAGREVFWDFLKNLAVAGGFLMIALGPDARSALHLVYEPFSSTNPYASFSAGMLR